MISTGKSIFNTQTTWVDHTKTHLLRLLCNNQLPHYNQVAKCNLLLLKIHSALYRRPPRSVAGLSSILFVFNQSMAITITAA